MRRLLVTLAFAIVMVPAARADRASLNEALRRARSEAVEYLEIDIEYDIAAHRAEKVISREVLAGGDAAAVVERVAKALAIEPKIAAALLEAKLRMVTTRIERSEQEQKAIDDLVGVVMRAAPGNVDLVAFCAG